MILFAKAPVAGRVKTRLAAAIGAEQAAELHRAFVADALEKLCEFMQIADVELHTDIATDAWRELRVARDSQAAGTLELKLLHAVGRGLEAGRPLVMILGSDSPTLPRGHIEGLLASQSDVALGPCEDGGYYAIACRRSDPAMFDGVEWSTANVLADTERAARSCGLSVERGELWYDVDGPEDLARLLKERSLPRHTAAAIQTIRNSGRIG